MLATPQLDFFAARPAAPLRPHALRPYQREAADAVLAAWSEERSALVVLPTGTGKSVLFSTLAREVRGRVLLLVHRDHLCRQGLEHLERATGERVELEQGGSFAAGRSRLMVASKDTLYRARRLGRFGTDHFDHVIIDEAHRSVAATYRPILDHFGAAKVLGVTATPDRTDRASLGAVFGRVAYQYEIRRAIADGWLCDIDCRRLHIAGINLDAVKRTAGDLNQGELDQQIGADEALASILGPTHEMLGASGKRVFVFATGKATAARMAQILNSYRPGCADYVTDDVVGDERQLVLRRHMEGEYQYLVSVGVLTEGYDDPGASVAVMARPTSSRLIYTQSVGRVLRPLPGIVDGPATPAERCAAIAASAKPESMVLDFVGVSTKHKLVGPEDVLGGEISPEVVRRARLMSSVSKRISVSEALLAAEKKIADERRLVEIKEAALRVRYHTEQVDPFGDTKGAPMRRVPRWEEPPTSKQIWKLRTMGVAARPKTKREASRLIGQAIKGPVPGVATSRQVAFLANYGLRGTGTSHELARAACLAVWNESLHGTKPVPPAVLARVAADYLSRQPGEEG